MNFLILPGFVVMGSRSPKLHVTSVSIGLMAVGTTLVFEARHKRPLLPRSLGGEETDPMTLVRVVEEVSAVR